MATLSSFSQFQVNETRGTVGFLTYDTSIPDADIYDYQDQKCEKYTYDYFRDASNFRMLLEHLGDIVREYTGRKDQDYILGEVAGVQYRLESEEKMRRHRPYTDVRYAQIQHREHFTAWQKAYEAMPVNSEELCFLKLAIHFVFQDDYRSVAYNLNNFLAAVGIDREFRVIVK